MATQGISGLAVAAGAAGGILLYAGIQDVDLVEAIREVAAGRQPAGRAAKVADVTWGAEKGVGKADYTPGDTTAASTAFVATAAAQFGKPYRWGAEGPDAFDCSGLVVYCLQRVGVNVGRLTTWGFATWSGARTIPASEAAPGDLVMYSGHMGIMSGPGQMIDAPRTGKNVGQKAIWRGQGGPWYRRVRMFEAGRGGEGRGVPGEKKPR